MYACWEDIYMRKRWEGGRRPPTHPFLLYWLPLAAILILVAASGSLTLFLSSILAASGSHFDSSSCLRQPHFLSSFLFSILASSLSFILSFFSLGCLRQPFCFYWPHSHPFGSHFVFFHCSVHPLSFPFSNVVCVLFLYVYM